MSFDNIDMSNFNGRPLLLVEFLYGSKFYYYTNADRDIPWNNSTYVATNIAHGGYSQSGDASADSITLDCAASLDIVKQWRGTPPTDSIYLTIREHHYNDPDNEADVAWMGTVSDVRRTSLMNAQIVGQQMSMTFKRGGLRLAYTKGCPYFVYDVNCKLNPDNFATNGVITAVGGDWFECAEAGSKAAPWFSGGFMKFEREPGSWDQYGIETHVGNRITLMGAADRLAIGMNVVMYPGCARVSSVCKNKFGNDLNYGGYNGMPGRSPFDGNPVF
ncbi:tail assembly protein [Burkholderia phage BcepNazgul]|uniref:Conserved tail assembly protein n=1 Tax=Burkholderia phage BcepNazgul TaxID=242861 RepID=Q6UYJ5_9CAUD|nr:tail assembly protein [Burkholderia phage BcepNazgul]AAQ63346.1 conserved tail assembly protein [Burkholderia phage BcepNazgul]